ncbi:MAG: ATP synthase F1 subunit gamma [Candidatus Brocadiales bacterium]|nr:ATP synthase F1 subunit gamma [Candidatus Brocadiales bacterium]
MLSTREIKQRIKGITNIQQITRAMEMVAANRLKKAEARVLAARPYHEKIGQLLNFLAANAMGKTHYLLKERDVKTIRILVITSDKGLCGAYNTNILQHVLRFLKENSHKEIRPIIMGKKGFLFFQKRRHQIEKYFPEAVERLGTAHITELTRQLITDFEQGAYQELHLFFTKFATVMKCIPTGIKLLPIEPKETPEKGAYRVDYIFEPYAEEIFSRLFPKYLESCIRQALWESLASEYAARRVAMIAASENAEEIINDLTRSYNKARQEVITKELLEVVSGAEALLR